MQNIIYLLRVHFQDLIKIQPYTLHNETQMEHQLYFFFQTKEYTTTTRSCANRQKKTMKLNESNVRNQIKNQFQKSFLWNRGSMFLDNLVSFMGAPGQSAERGVWEPLPDSSI